MSTPVTTTVEDGVAVVRLDDGKVNALSMDVIQHLHAALDQAEGEATAVCIVGNAKALSAGFDLAVMRGGAEGMIDLVRTGGRLLMRIYGHPQPTVVAVTGHALAAGALLVLTCDTRVGADGPAKIGLNETAIGMTLPEFAVELARDRLSKRYVTRAAVQAEIFSPEGALAAGWLDRVVPAAECERTAVEEARRLGQLDVNAYGGTKRLLRQETIDKLRPTLEGSFS
ncbi:MAG: enoyl-CoA hydratase [Acidimicrobiales bacterium]|nr:enoyl-CoA hydratase [Acidimicrobiales bacterium]